MVPASIPPLSLASFFSEFVATINYMMGRPKKPDSERKDSELRIRLTAQDRLALDKAAQSAGKETSTWARHILLKNAGKPLPNPKK
jgi:hypothetical protein